MSSSPTERMSGASTPTLLAMSSFSTNRLHDELTGLKRWRQMYDTAMNEKNEELQKLQLINQRQAQALNDSIVQIEQQTVTISSMKQNETILEKKMTKLEEIHQILKKNVAKLEKTVSQCEFVRVDLERMYEHQERNVKNLADRVDSTIETKLENLKSQLKLIEQLYEQTRAELNKEKQERAAENHQSNQQMTEFRHLTNKIEVENQQLKFLNATNQSKINELTEELSKSQNFIDSLVVDHNNELKSKLDEIDNLNKRLDNFVLKIDASREELFNLHELNKLLQNRLDEMKQKSAENSEFHESEVQQRQAELEIREKENQMLKQTNFHLNEQMVHYQHEYENLHEKNQNLEKNLQQIKSNLDKQMNDFAKQSIEYENQCDEHHKELNEKERIFNEFKAKHHELEEKLDLTEEELIQLSKENEELRTQNHFLLQETDERNEQMKQKDVIVEATNIEIAEKDKEIEELKTKVTSLEERLAKNQNLLTSLRSSMGEKDAKIKRLEQGPIVSPSTLTSRSNVVRRTGSVAHPLAISTNKIVPATSMTQQPKSIQREKRMLPPTSTTEMTSTPKKIFRSSQTKTTIDEANGSELFVDDDRDEVASNTSVASLFEYLKKI